MSDRRLTGKRILIVEDEYFIASDLKRALDEREAVVLGPMASLGAGLAALDGGGRIDMAVLDVNLNGDESFEIADRLTQRGVPIMFLTGYDGWALPSAHRGTPRLAKPFAPDAVVRVIERLVAAAEKQ